MKAPQTQIITQTQTLALPKVKKYVLAEKVNEEPIIIEISNQNLD